MTINKQQVVKDVLNVGLAATQVIPAISEAQSIVKLIIAAEPLAADILIALLNKIHASNNKTKAATVATQAVVSMPSDFDVDQDPGFDGGG